MRLVMNADEPTVRLLDGLVGFWLVLWLAVGVASGYTFWDASSLGDTVTNSGEALGSAGAALETVGEVPVVGEGPAQLGSEVSATAVDIASSGAEIKTELRRLSLLLGLSIALMPTTPVLGLYLPLRLTRRRDARDLQRALGQHGRDPALNRYLAERATHMLPYSVVRSISDNPFEDIAAGRTQHLADAELKRMGLRPSTTQA